jgi:hypothetical protein
MAGGLGINVRLALGRNSGVAVVVVRRIWIGAIQRPA